jgi:hypothetical protein
MDEPLDSHRKQSLEDEGPRGTYETKGEKSCLQKVKLKKRKLS